MKNALEMDILGADEVAIPTSIARADLTLAEIGAIVILKCVMDSPEEDRQAVFARLQSEDMVKAMHDLKEKGVFSVTSEDGNINVKIDLGKVGAQ